MSDQGQWNFGISFDELPHYTSDSYQTPYTGSMGGNSFTLPGLWCLCRSGTRTRVLSAAQLGQFHNMDISNNRDNTSMTGRLILDRQWNIKLDFNHLDRSGAKLFGFGSSQVGTGVGGTEKVSILPMPTNYTTDTVNLALNWLGDKGHATASYFGSFFP